MRTGDDGDEGDRVCISPKSAERGTRKDTEREAIRVTEADQRRGTTDKRRRMGTTAERNAKGPVTEGEKARVGHGIVGGIMRARDEAMRRDEASERKEGHRAAASTGLGTKARYPTFAP